MLLDWEGGEIVYTYDGDGNLVKSVIDNKTTYYPNQYYEKRMVDAQQTIYKYYFVGSARIALRENGTITWLLSDHLGSTSGTVSAVGVLVSTMKYTAFGETRGTGSSTTDYRYTGQREEEEIGLYFYKARFYDPYLNHFIQPDTIIPDPYNPLDWDRYNYVRNSPVNYTDPSGHCIELDEGFCLHEDTRSGRYHLVNGKGLFKNYVEIAIANYIISGDPRSLNRIPDNPPSFMVGAAMENACEGLGYDCGTRFRNSIWLFTVGVLGAAGSRYPGSSANTLPGSIGQDALGNPDCAGCGYLLPETSVGSTGRTTPSNLREQLAMEAAMADPERGTRLPITLGDPRWPANEGWLKMTQYTNGVEIHYNYNVRTGQSADFKFPR